MSLANNRQLQHSKVIGRFEINLCSLETGHDSLALCGQFFYGRGKGIGRRVKSTRRSVGRASGLG